MTATIIEYDFRRSERELWPPIRGTYSPPPEPDEHDGVNEPPYPRTSFIGICIACAAFWATVAWAWW